MKRICLAVLVLLVLSACGRAEPAEPVDTTEAMRTTRYGMTKHLMSNEGLFVFKKDFDFDYFSAYAQEIWLRDKSTGKEILLLSERPDGTMPCFDGEINARYFVYHYGNPEADTTSGMEIYDLQEQRTLQVKCNGENAVFDQVMDEKVYLRSRAEGDDEKRIFYFDIAALDSGGPITANRLMPPPLKETETHMETADAVVFTKATDWSYYFGYRQEIWLRDKATGEETLLLGPDTYEHTMPYFTEKINDRYFTYYYAIPETCHADNSQIYDLDKLRPIQIDYSECAGLVFFDHIADEKIYLYGWVGENRRTYTISIAALDSDGPIIPKEVPDA